MANMPRIAEVQCQPVRFEPGARIFVKTKFDMTPDEQRRFRAQLCRFAREPIEVFFINTARMELEIECGNKRITI